MGGNHLGNAGNWKGYFTVPYEADPTTALEAYRIWCDSQVNYEVDLEFLYDHLDEWLAVWEHMWLFNSKVAGVRVSRILTWATRSCLASNMWFKSLQRSAVAGRQGQGQSVRQRAADGVAAQRDFNEPQIIRQLKSLVMMLFRGGLDPAGGWRTHQHRSQQELLLAVSQDLARLHCGGSSEAAKRTTVRRMASHTRWRRWGLTRRGRRRLSWTCDRSTIFAPTWPASRTASRFPASKPVSQGTSAADATITGAPDRAGVQADLRGAF